MYYAYELARSVLRRSVERQKRLYNERVFGEPVHKGDLVWVAEKTKKKGKSPKLQPRWKGPCLVIDVLNDVVIKVQLGPKKTSNLHIDLLKPCTIRRPPAWIRKRLRKLHV